MSDPKRRQPGRPKRARARIKLDDLKVRKETLKQLSGGEAADVKGGLRMCSAETHGSTVCYSTTCAGAGNMPC